MKPKAQDRHMRAFMSFKLVWPGLGRFKGLTINYIRMRVIIIV